MSHSHPSAEPVVTSPGRTSPPDIGRPFLDLISAAYQSEGRQVPDRVLAVAEPEKTIAGHHIDDTEESDGVTTAEDRPSRRLRTIAAQPLRALVADPLTSLADASPSLISVTLRGELRSLPVVIGRSMDRCGRSIVTSAEVEPEAQAHRHGAGIRILPPVESSPARRSRRPPPLPEPTQIRRPPPPPLPDFAIPPRPRSAAGIETDPHGRVFTAEKFLFGDVIEDVFEDVLLDDDERRLDDVTFGTVLDDTDPFAHVIDLDAEIHAFDDADSFDEDDRDHTIELSLELLDELLQQEEEEGPNPKTSSLCLEDLGRLATSHGLSFVGTFDDDNGETIPTFSARDFYSDWDDTSENAMEKMFLPVVVGASELQDVENGMAVLNDPIDALGEFDAPNTDYAEDRPTSSFTLTGLVLARPTEDGEMGAQRRKAHNIFAAAMEDYAAGRKKAANTNAMLALAYDPASKVYRAAVSRWSKEARGIKAG